MPSFKTLRLLLIAAVLILCSKLWLAAILDLYSDEVFYWLASQSPALAYSDLPFMTALLTGVGSSFDPGNPLAARSLFIILGTVIPLLIYWIAKPVVGRKQAIEASALSLCLPLGGFLGLLAVPDVPLIAFGLFSIGCFERALRTDETRFWIGTGVFMALGFATHYRFALYPMAACLFLLLPANRPYWRKPVLWLAIAIASLGLLPIIWFNLNFSLSSASFYFVERHPWQFQASGLLHIFKQAGLVTPPLYMLLGLTLWHLLVRARKNDATAALFASFGLVNIAVYLVLAPWTDATSTSIHWPLSGYFPLLVFAPATLRKVHAWLATRMGLVWANRTVAAVPAIGILGTFIALYGIGTQAFQTELQKLVGPGVLSNKMAGWRQFHLHTAELIKDQFTTEAPVIVTDNYYTAAQIQFGNVAPDAYTLDLDKAVRDGRITQFQLWSRDESGLIRETNNPALFITEDSEIDIPDKEDFLRRACEWSEVLEKVSELELFSGDKQFSYYRASRLLDRSSANNESATPCPYFARAWIDTPPQDAMLTGTADIQGWAYNEDIGIREVQIWVNDELVGTAEYGSNRDDVVSVMNVSSDPNSPDLGFRFSLDTSRYNNGAHTLELILVNNQGAQFPYGRRTIHISN